VSKLHASTALPPGRTPVSIEEDDELAPEVKVKVKVKFTL